MRSCKDVEWIVRTAEQWRDMDPEVFEANLASFTAALRAYHAKNEAYRARPGRFRWAFAEALA